jgi:hypothetical protein
MPARAPQRAAHRGGCRERRYGGGFTFAEHPARAAPDARIIWHAEIDPGTLRVIAEPVDPTDPDSLRVDRLKSLLTIAQDGAGHEHAVLSDGYRHIRLDVVEGSLEGAEAVLLHYRLRGIASAERGLLPLRRFVHLCRTQRFARSLFPTDPWIARWVMTLRVHDAVANGASQREIASVLFGGERVETDWFGPSESLRSRVKRLVRDARAMARGGYRFLLRRGAR